jgi:hypothetical protein
MSEAGSSTQRWQPDPDGPAWLVTVHWSIIDGRHEPVGLEVRSYTADSDEKFTWGRPDLGAGRVPPRDEAHGVVTSSLLRSLPLGSILEDALRSAAGSVAVVADDLREVGRPFWEGPEADELRDRFRAGQTSGRGGRPRLYDAEHWSEVAKVYTEAWRSTDERRRAPTRAVAEHFTVAKSTAAKWVARCRDLGLLPPTSKGRADAGRGDQ